MRNVGVSTIAMLVMSGAGWIVSGLDTVVHPPQPPAGLEAHETHASASLLGQFRTSISSWLWVRTDLYLHNGVQLRPMTEAERRAGVTSSSPAKDGHEQLLNENSVATVIPPKERDFRGIFGDVERLTDTYKDMHSHHHNNPKLALPLFRLMTWIDPQFVPGWTTGAVVITWDRKPGDVERAIAYLEEGLRNNPDSAAILSDLGRVAVVHQQDRAKAVEYLERARSIGRRCDFRTLPDIESDGLEQAYRWLALCYRDLGKADAEHQVLGEGIRLFPDDMVLIRLYNPPPAGLSRKEQARWLDEQAAKIRASGERTFE